MIRALVIEEGDHKEGKIGEGERRDPPGYGETMLGPPPLQRSGYMPTWVRYAIGSLRAEVQGVVTLPASPLAG